MDSKKLLEALSKNERNKLLKAFKPEEFAKEALRRHVELAPLFEEHALAAQPTEDASAYREYPDTSPGTS